MKVVPQSVGRRCRAAGVKLTRNRPASWCVDTWPAWPNRKSLRSPLPSKRTRASTGVCRRPASQLSRTGRSKPAPCAGKRTLTATASGAVPKRRFGDHVPLIRRQDVRGLVDRKPVWLIRPLGLKTGPKNRRKHGGGDAPLLRGRLQTHHQYRYPTILGNLAEEERNHAVTAEQIG